MRRPARSATTRCRPRCLPPWCRWCIQQEGYFPDGILQKDLNNFGPRIGAAYNLNDRMVLRSGFGIYYDNLNLNELQFTRLIPPYYGQFSLNPTVAAPLQVDYAVPRSQQHPAVPGAVLARSGQPHAVHACSGTSTSSAALAATTWPKWRTPAAAAGT